MSYINTGFVIADSETKIIPLDRHGFPAYAVQLDAGAILVEGTIQQLNRGQPGIWHTLNDLTGTAMAAVATGITGIENNPIEAIRITATGAVVGRLMQTGSD